MGITDQGLEFLLSARREGVDFERTMTLGRQFLLASPERLGECVPALAPLDAGDAAHGFAEPLLRLLGAEEVCSIDASDFEGATHVHDLNTPVDASLSGRFTAVLDGGCLEHVFDFPTAMRSCMRMVGVGGHLLCMPPVNNAAGHGFYQFSPELYFRALSPENGFIVERMLLAEVRPGAMWYRVVDPAAAGHRVEFTTRHQAYLYVQARRIDDRSPLTVAPVQSDYDVSWRGVPGGERIEAPAYDGADGRLLAAARRAFRAVPLLHVPVRRLRTDVASFLKRRHPYGPPHFEPVGRRLR